MVLDGQYFFLQDTPCCSSCRISSTSCSSKPNKHGSRSTSGSKWTHILSVQPSELWWHGCMWQPWCKYYIFFSMCSISWSQPEVMMDLPLKQLLFFNMFSVQDRMVSFWLCWCQRTTQGKVVLLGLCWTAETAEREVMLRILPYMVHIKCICCLRNIHLIKNFLTV